MHIPSMMLLFVLLVILLAAMALQMVWALRHGYPPAGTPHVLCFHKLSDRFLWEGTWTTPGRFAAIIDRLRARGYTFIDEAHYLAALDHPSADAAMQIFLTFDDGYADTIEAAHAVLAPRGIPMHVFLVSDYAGRDNAWDLSLGRAPVRHLSWERVRELSRMGVT
ncbi:MAG TPA: polysaccharide deacetylase family protein, partial [Candidatus Krumholzibacteria bacterium]|nr:polysaccharide deacetylase family protein [Candidatus Krumholzibacteria bacterium]